MQFDLTNSYINYEHAQHELVNSSRDFIESLCGEFQRNNQINPSYYEKWDVKRGLRNADGTGADAHPGDEFLAVFEGEAVHDISK